MQDGSLKIEFKANINSIFLLTFQDMKRLLLTRHAKATWGGVNILDHDRELDDEGVEEAKQMSKKLIDESITCDSMIKSSASRALSTCKIVASELNFKLDDIKIDKSIYGSNCKQLKEIICKTDECIESLAVFGHNPTLCNLSESLYGKPIFNFPTCSMLYVELVAESWHNCFNSDKRTLFFKYPQNV